MATSDDVLAQLERAGLKDYIAEVDAECDGESISGRMRVTVLNALARDDRFASGPLYQLHKDVGKHPAEWRAFTGQIGKGSLQIVIDKQTGRFHADVDRYNPYADLVGFVGHAVGEVLPYFVRRLFKRRAKVLSTSPAGSPEKPTTNG